jgi:hypothetical protein
MMSKAAKILCNSLILLAMGAAVPAAWAASPADPATHFSVPIQPADVPPKPRVLDLKAPDVRDVMSPEEMAAALSVPEETEVVEGPETVAVHGAVQAPYVPSGFAALYWAATHPLSAWRILAPAQ